MNKEIVKERRKRTRQLGEMTLKLYEIYKEKEELESKIENLDREIKKIQLKIELKVHKDSDYIENMLRELN